MKNLFDFDATANQSLYSGDTATRAAGLPVPGELPGSFAPGASNATADAMVETMRQRTRSLQAAMQQPPIQGPSKVGYNPETNEFFSQGRTFKADLNEGRQAAAAGFFDVDNPELPPGFLPVYGTEAKAKLQKDFESQGMLSDLTRRTGQFVAGAGSTLRDLGLPGAQTIEQYGADVAARNPSQISTAGDILDKPLTAAGEAVGEAGFDIAKAAATGYAGTKAGAAAGSVFGPGGAALGAILGGAAGIFLPTVFETYGSVRREQREQGIDDRGRALVAGAGSAALETALGPEAAIGRIMAKKAGAVAARDLLQAGALKAIGRGVATGAVVEGPLTEVPQSAIERFGAYKPLTGEEALNEYLIGGFKGAVGGAAMTTVTSSIEYQQAANFANNLMYDQQLATNPAVPSAERIAAARRVQAVLQGASDDPQFNQQLQEFRQKLARLENMVVSAATTDALTNGTPLSLLDTVTPEVAPPAVDTGTPLERDRTAEQEARWAAAQGQEAPAPELSTLLNVGQVGQQWQDLQAARERALQAAQAVGPAAQEAIARRSALISMGGDAAWQAGEAARPLVESLEQNVPLSAVEAGQEFDQVMSGNMEAALSQPRKYRGYLDTQLAALGGEPDMASLIPQTPVGPVRGPTSPLPAPSQQRISEPLVQQAAPTSAITERPAAAPAPAPVAPIAPAAPVAEAPVAPAPAAPRRGRKPAGQVQDTATLQKLLDDVDTAPLEASVEAPAGMRVPGKTSLTANTLAQVRDALLSPEGTVPNISPRAQQLADAARAAAKAYYKYLNAGGNALRGIPTQRAGKPTKFAGLTPAEQRGQTKQKAGKQTETAAKYLEQVTAAMTALGQAAGNNAKDVEVVVKLVKDMVQRQVASDIENTSMAEDFDESSMTGALRKLDAMLSQLWGAAKYGMFTGGTDSMFVRQQALRTSREVAATGEPSPIERAAQGYSTFGSEEEYTGLSGVLTYIRTHGTPFERLLAKAARDALYFSGREPKLEFIDSGRPRYDPNTNTVYLSRNESPAVVLHEALHSALQWYVINNPDAPEVKALKVSLKQVVNYKGDLPAKAKEVQNLLKNLMASGNELDAVLELISYGNTLNDFRRAMQAMPGKGVPKTFFDAVNNLWQNILTVVQKMLGVEPSVASDVIANTFKLLQAAGTVKGAEAAAMTKKGGNVLEAAVTADNFDTVSEAQLLQRPGAAVPTGVDISNFNKRIVPEALSSKVLFDLIGWPKWVAKGEKALAGVADSIREDWPAVTRWISYVNSRFGVPQDVRGFFEQYKDDRQAGYKLTERLATYIQFQPADKVSALFAYLDGDKTVLKDDAATRELADEVKKWRDFYVQELNNDKAREFFSRGKFSETMLFASRSEQVASATFGARKLNQLLGQKTRYEADLADSWLDLDAQGDPILTGQFYQVFKRESDGTMVPQGFISRSRYEKQGAPAGFTIDPTFLWYHQSKSKQGHKFVANMTAAQAIAENKADDLANALRNTMASLAGNYATLQFASSVAKYGREEGGTPVVFESLAEIEKMLGIKVPKDAVLSASADAAKSAVMQHQYRSPNLWVQLPKSPAYGELAGKIVRGSVWSAMTDMSDRQPVIKINALNDTMRWFKKSKTVYNPGTHLTNVATNFTMAMMHDIPVATVIKAAKLFIDYEVRPNSMSTQDRQLVLSFINSNAMLGDYSSAEVKQALYDAMKDSLQDGSPSLMGRLAAFAKIEKGKAEAAKQLVGRNLDKADQIATEIYSAEDNVFRLAAFLKHAADLSAQKGGNLTAQDLQAAGDYARWAFLDYDIDSKAVRVARQTVLPFVSWTYAIIPVLGRIAVHQPWKMVNLLLAYTILEHVMQELGGGDEEDEKQRKVGPEYIRDRMFGFGPYMHVRLPFLGDDQNPVYYRLGDYIPVASLARGLPNGFMGQDWWPSAVTPTGPFVTAVIAAIAGVDPYTGKPLSPPTEDQWGKFVDRSQILAGQFVPPPVADAIKWDRVEDIYKGRTDKTENYAAMQFARWAGLKMYDYNVEEAAALQGRAARAIMTEYKKEINRLKRAEARYENPDWEGFMAKQQELLTRMQEEMAKAKGEE